ncbi:MAG: hypothetical protein H6672_22555 [Anaerolineaceae bacterium]|nr:hypothetical protein [Anaerolineaceae bacterium]
MKHRVWIISIAVALVASVVGVGFAAAQGGHGFGQGADMGFGRSAGGSMLTTVAEQLDMTVADLVTEIQGGKTVAQIAEEKGVALDTIISAITTQSSEELAARVEAGELTQAQADARIALETANLNAEFANTLSLGRGMNYIGQSSPMLAAVAGALSMDITDLETELQAGKTVAQVAEEKGVALDTVVAAVTAMHTAQITARVASGELTQEQADAMLTLDSANITAMLSGEMSFGMGMDFGGRGAFNGPMGGRGGFNGPMGGRGGFNGPMGGRGYNSPTTPSTTPEPTTEANT